MNNDIKESYCSFEVSKLLKEKGFNVPCSTHWEWGNDDKKQNLPAGIYIGGFLDKENLPRPYSNTELMKSYFVDTDQFGEFSRPTQQLAIDWIRINFGFIIWSEPILKKDSIMFFYNVKKYKVQKLSKLTELFNTPEEAKEAAITYVFTKLITHPLYSIFFKVWDTREIR